MGQMPQQRPGKSEQVVCTPPEFLVAIKRYLGIAEFDIDVAASKENKVAPLYLSEEPGRSAFENSWCVEEPESGWTWCNPPYSDIAPWVRRARAEADFESALVCMLVPASTGSNWWRDYVNGVANVVFLNGRITFVGHDSPYPKDLAILLYTKHIHGGYTVFDWE